MACTICSKSSGLKPKLFFFPRHKIFASFLLVPFLILSFAPHSWAVEKTPALYIPSSASKPAATNYFAQQFFMRPEQKLSFKTTEIDGLVFVQTPNHERRANYSLVTDFSGPVMRTQYVSGPMNLQELQKWVRENLKKRVYKGVEVKRVTVSSGEGGKKPLYIVGHRGFKSSQDVRKELAQTRAVIEAQGGNFDSQVQEANHYYFPPESPVETARAKAQFEKEEALFLKYFDQMDIGNELFGPFQGVPSGDRITWQSFGETSWRLTNLEQNAYKSGVGYWTNRVVFKGIKAPFNTLDPYVEGTINLDATGIDYKSNLILVGGLEWRPFARNAWLENTRFWSLPLLSFIRNYRFYTEYMDRKSIKDEIVGSKSYDMRAGVGIFYEWGIEPPPITEGAPDSIPEYIRRYVWGEYFGNYYYTHTNFASYDNPDTFIFNSSVILGFKLPGIPLPPNPINDEFVIMPYFRFEHVNSAEYPFPYENRYFVAVGGRWMPFANYRYKDNEWLAKTKLFIEYVGVGRVKNWKQDGEAPDTTDYDFRIGLNFSQKRY